MTRIFTEEEQHELDMFHTDFEREDRNLMYPVKEALIDLIVDNERLEQEHIIAQFLMEHLNPHTCDPARNVADFPTAAGVLTPDNKMRLVKIANHMGPDYAQALYHAAVFITKVA